MKKLIFCPIFLLPLFLISCGNGESMWVSTEIKFANESSYNLRISIKAIPPHSDFSREMDIKKGEFEETWIEYVRQNNSDKPRNPNEETVKIRFFNSDTKGLIKEMLNENNLFEFVKTDEKNVDYYLFNITDSLLSE